MVCVSLWCIPALCPVISERLLPPPVTTVIKKQQLTDGLANMVKKQSLIIAYYGKPARVVGLSIANSFIAMV